MQHNVLLVEDRPASLRQVGEQLRASDVQVHTAFGIELGMQAVAEILPDLVVFELGAPLGDGLGDLERFAAFAAHHALPVLFTSAHESVDFRRLTREFGAVGYFEEPYEIGDVMMLVRMALPRPPGLEQRQLGLAQLG